MNSKASLSEASKNYRKGRYAEALDALNALIDIRKDAETYALLARTLAKLGLKSEAASAFTLAAGFEEPDAADHLREAMKLHFEDGNEDQALLYGMRLLPKAPKDADIAFVLVSIFMKRGRMDIARQFKVALSESPLPLHHNLARKLLTDDFGDETNHQLARNLLKHAPDSFKWRFLNLIYARESCDFEAIDRLSPPVRKALAKGQVDILANDLAFCNISWTGSERLNRMATIGLKPVPPALTAARRTQPHRWGEKIRIGYVSADFWDMHATMKLLQGVLELHDRKRFDVTLFCHTPKDNLARNRTDRSRWGTVVDIHGLANDAVAEIVRAREIDVLVDLKGHTLGSRPGIFNAAAAPIQVGWLGFPGSTTHVDLDYVIGDPVVLPESSKAFYHEKFCRLPDCYQPNDPLRRPLAAPTPRPALGLPEAAFVLASFNANRKITAETLDRWFAILRQAENSLLWILPDNGRTEANIRKRAQAAGIDGERIRFTSKMNYEDHLNRLPAADLGLDTWPYNGHTTTSEQLWAGVPVLTVKGTNFASRVSESLLNTIGLPELVAADADHYVATAVSLSRDRERLAGYRERLAANRFTMPLFDAERFCRHLERAFEAMVERAKAGLAPDHLDVSALPARNGSFAPTAAGEIAPPALRRA
ncbi:glycosyl transferase [Rhizobium sp. TRM95111]|uniref:O-linked N-acetylglucosamine transferase, SPINDLY family protein n=1 Tax=Rhizobium alarense TaxID=2846851 RepID=UPI001F37E95C|nr:glycosyltransferase family 41 protein [Rhizobium alarense]MCF3641341.1 glycosyl transferase [Rhizobium alarense]